MSPRTLFISILLSTLALVSACASMLPEYRSVISPILTSDTELLQVRNTSDTTVLHRTKFGSVRAVNLRSDLKVTRGSKTYDIKPRNNLLLARFKGSDDLVYCSDVTTFSGTNFMGISGLGHSCLVDKNKDGKFETIYAGMLPTLGSNILDNRMLVSPPAEYESTTIPSDEVYSVDVILKFVEGIGGSQFIDVLIDDQRYGLPVRNGRAEISDYEQFPVTVDLLGVKVELLSLDEGVLTYQVMSDFDPDLELIVGTDF